MQLAAENPTEELTNEQKDQIIVKVGTDPQYRKGRYILWRKALNDHPEYKSALMYAGAKGTDMTRASQRWAELRSPSDNPTVKTPAEPKASPEKKRKMVLKIAKRFTMDNGNIDWKAAFAKIKKAKHILAPDGDMNRAYLLVDAMRKEGKLPSGVKQTNGHSTALVHNAKGHANGIANGTHPAESFVSLAQVEVEKEVERRVAERLEHLLNEARYCPRCAKDVGQGMHLAMVEEKHARQIQRMNNQG